MLLRQFFVKFKKPASYIEFMNKYDAHMCAHKLLYNYYAIVSWLINEKVKFSKNIIEKITFSHQVILF